MTKQTAQPFVTYIASAEWHESMPSCLNLKFANGGRALINYKNHSAKEMLRKHLSVLTPSALIEYTDDEDLIALINRIKPFVWVQISLKQGKTDKMLFLHYELISPSSRIPT